MKKKKVKKIEANGVLFSKIRYVDAGWTMTKDGERIYCFDIIESKQMYFTIEEWDKKQMIRLSSVEYKIYYDKIVEYWKGRK